MRGVKEVTCCGAKFVDGQEVEFDAIILATGYKSNVPSWLKVGSCFFTLSHTNQHASSFFFLYKQTIIITTIRMSSRLLLPVLFYPL